MSGDEQQQRETRAGDVALVGRPNVGKSTLLNALTGEHLSIVTPRAQTTRERVLGIVTSDAVQVVFVDTPGLLDPSYLLQRGMLEEAVRAIREADGVLLLLDGGRPGETPSEDVIGRLRARGDAVRVAINKIDTAKPKAVAQLADWSRQTLGIEPLRISAETGDGLAELREVLAQMVPASPFLYPVDDIAVQSVRFFVEELIRETVFELYQDEIPYSSAVRIEEFREADEPVFIRATVFVERETQKGILVGQKGAGIKRLGREARGKIEKFLDRRVYLDLWVKTLPGWRRKRSSLEYLGYPVSREESNAAQPGRPSQ